jgi:hypothetical protein
MWKELIHPTPNAFAGASDGKNTGMSFVVNVTLPGLDLIWREPEGAEDKRKAWFCRKPRCYSEGRVG